MCSRPAWAEHQPCRTGCSTTYCATCRRITGSGIRIDLCPCVRRDLYPIDMQHKPSMKHLVKGGAR